MNPMPTGSHGTRRQTWDGVWLQELSSSESCRSLSQAYLRPGTGADVRERAPARRAGTRGQSADRRQGPAWAQLYFDTRLSADSTISCASCHDPRTGWADPHPTDTGIRGQVGGRNSGTMVNAGHMRFQFWDGRAPTLEEQAVGPIHNPIEMGETHENVVRKLNGIAGYREQFQEVFGPDADIDGVAKAIASFERTVISGPSPYDRYMMGDKIGDERGGGAWHEPLQRQGALHALPQRADVLRPVVPQPRGGHGRGEARFWAVQRDQRSGGHRALQDPMLRNVALTPPYLHDGSAKTLMDVVDVYDRGGKPNPHLDPLMFPLNLTAREKADLVAFMEALTGALPEVEIPTSPKAAHADPKGGLR